MKTKWFIGSALTVLTFIWWILSFYPDWIWFEKLHYSGVFWKMVLCRFGVGVGIWLLLMLMVLLSLYVARRLRVSFRSGPVSGGDILAQLGFSGITGGFFLAALAIVGSFVIASRGASRWDMVLSYLNQQPFGAKDPVFMKDIGFFVFSLPFYLFLQHGLLVLVYFSCAVTVVWYLKNGAIQISNLNEFMQPDAKQAAFPRIDIAPGPVKHLLFFGGIVVLLIAWGYRLKMFGLLYSTSGAAFGAGYTDIHVRMPVYGFLIFLCLAFALLLFVNAFRTKIKQVWIGGGIWLGLTVVIGTLLPMVVEKTVVKPNQLAKESPYIDHNIRYTRQAYHLDKIREVDFSVADTLSMADISADHCTIQNIRIWDKRPLLQTYNQLQSIRMYYDFNDVDVDRYRIKENYRQVMLSARELSVDQLPPQANTWVNRHLIYTHGYGLAMNPVNRVTSEGLPDLIIKDLPPAIGFDLRLERPEIYYGQKTDDYVLVKTKTKEFDYPKGDMNVYTHYRGTGGVHISSFLRRALFSLEFLDPQILFTTYLSPESRIMYNRRIDTRVRAIAPFLDYDGDPYLVVSGGRLYWLLDAYTTSDMYPYSIRLLASTGRRLNYIRNSVKITVDAYNGDVCFYTADSKDPILRTYAHIFPHLFKPFGDMPDGLKRHVRYPRDLFRIQADIYRTYHMKDVQVFYNQEDFWQMPDEIYGSTRQKMEPYYIIIRLPMEKREEYVLMFPFTPSKKDNMIAWLAARCDVPNYGNLIVYRLPKEKLVFGPMQIEARIDQQTHISKELTLWGQRGSNVIRGNLLVIPIRDTFIYVEPVYLEAKQSEPAPVPPQGPRGRMIRSRPGYAGSSDRPESLGAAALPELKRVIVAFGNRVVMETDLETALVTLLGGKTSDAGVRPSTVSTAASSFAPGSVEKALEHFNRARERLRRGDWAGYGEELAALEKVLKQMAAAKTDE